MRWIAVVLTLLFAAPADAASVRARIADESWKDLERRFVTWQIADRHGVPDRLVVRSLAGGIEVSADGPLSAGRACRKHHPRVVRCATPHRPGADTEVSFDIDLAGGSDRLVLRGAGPAVATVRAGGGRDVVDGRRAPGALSLFGGSGADRLYGGAHRDELAGGGGSDALHGGGGSDAAVWSGRRAVRADLAKGRARSGRTTDGLTAIERLRGGAGGDELLGDAGPNEIDGGGGGDRIRGRAGDDLVDGEGLRGEDFAVDVVDGGTGDDWVSGLGGGDVLIGGAGDDLLRNLGQAKWRKRPSRARCGDGRDVVAYPAPEDLVGASCETIDHRYSGWAGPAMQVPPAAVSEGWRVPISYRCSVDAQTRCRVAVVLTEAGSSRVLGSAEAEVAPGAERTFALRLTAEGLEAVRRRGSLLGRFAITSDEGRYTTDPVGATLRLTAPG